MKKSLSLLLAFGIGSSWASENGIASETRRGRALGGLGWQQDYERYRVDPIDGGTAWYALSFEAKSETNGYWWVEFSDAKGKWIPDVNSRLDPSSEFRRREVAVPVRFDVAEAVVSFVSRGRVEARRISFRRITAAKAAERFRLLAAENPPVRDLSGENAWVNATAMIQHFRAAKAGK